MAKTEKRFNPFLEGRNYPEFSREDIEALYEGFVQFDTDGSGALDKKEFAQALKFMGQACPADKLDAFFAKVDKDGSGFIEWGEFLQIMSAFYEIRKREVLSYYYTIARAFPQFTKKDQCFKSMGLGFNKQTVQALLTNLDVDGSGTLEWPEFLALLSLLFESYREDFEREFYEPAKEFTEFTQDDIDSMVLAFREFDADGSGSLDTHELLEVFKFMGQRCTKDQLIFILDKYDTDRSGTINWKEFLHIIRDFYQGTIHEPAKAAQPTQATKANTAAPAKTSTAPAKTTAAAPAKTTTAAPAAKSTTAAPAKTTAASPAKSTPAPASSSSSSNAPATSSGAPVKRERFGTATRVDTASLKAKFEALSKKN